MSDRIKTTQAVVLRGKDLFNDVVVTDWPLPDCCAKSEMKVSVEYCGVNFADVYHVYGKLIVRPEMPYVLGLECAGIVTDVGEDVTDFKIGDRVACYKPDAGLFKANLVVDQTMCHHVPDDISFKTASALLANYLTAHFALCMGKLHSGESVLIHSAAGGVGWAATQLASVMVSDVKVYGTASSSKHNDITANGVTTALTYDNCYETCQGVDLVIDNLGGKNVQKSLQALNPFGCVIVTGGNSLLEMDENEMSECKVDVSDLIMGNQSVGGFHLGMILANNPQLVKETVQYLFGLCQKGHIKPRIHTIYEFTEAVEAIKTLAERKNIGKVLIRVN